MSDRSKSGSIARDLVLDFGQRASPPRDPRDIAVVLDRLESMRARLEATSSNSRSSKIIGALILSAMIVELPEEAREAAAVKVFIEDLAGELDDAVIDTALLLASFSAHELQRVDDTLTRTPGAVMELFKIINQQLEKDAPRILRAGFRRVANRTRSQPFSALVRDCLEAVEVLAASAGFDHPLSEWPGLGAKRDTVDNKLRRSGGLTVGLGSLLVPSSAAPIVGDSLFAPPGALIGPGPLLLISGLVVLAMVMQTPALTFIS